MYYIYVNITNVETNIGMIMHKTKLNKLILLVIGAICTIIFLVVYFYNIEHVNAECILFYDSLQYIQHELEQQQTIFYDKIKMFKNNMINKEAFEGYTRMHTGDMDTLVRRYDGLANSTSFIDTIELFKSSTASQLKSDMFTIYLIKNNNHTDLIRSDFFLQESFEYESAALTSYNSIKMSYCKNIFK